VDELFSLSSRAGYLELMGDLLCLDACVSSFCFCVGFFLAGPASFWLLLEEGDIFTTLSLHSSNRNVNNTVNIRVMRCDACKRI
jgi:hypothetical protein